MPSGAHMALLVGRVGTRRGVSTKGQLGNRAGPGCKHLSEWKGSSVSWREAEVASSISHTLSQPDRSLHSRHRVRSRK